MRYESLMVVWNGRSITGDRDGTLLRLRDESGPIGCLELRSWLGLFGANQTSLRVLDVSEQLVATLSLSTTFGFSFDDAKLEFVSGETVMVPSPRRRHWLDRNDFTDKVASEISAEAHRTIQAFGSELIDIQFQQPRGLKWRQETSGMLFERGIPDETASPLFSSPLPESLDDRTASLLAVAAIRFHVWCHRPPW